MHEIRKYSTLPNDKVTDVHRVRVVKFPNRLSVPCVPLSLCVCAPLSSVCCSGCVCGRILSHSSAAAARAEPSDLIGHLRAHGASVMHAPALVASLSLSLSLTRFLTGCKQCMTTIIFYYVWYGVNFIFFLWSYSYITTSIHFLHCTLLVVLCGCFVSLSFWNVFYCFLFQAALKLSNNLFHGYFWHTK